MKRRMINFNDEQDEKLREKAFQERSNITVIVRQAVDLYFDKEKKNA
jgi:hypothetical protein